MPNQFTETTTRSWGSRLGGSLKGLLFGLLLFFVSFVVLWINEGNAVRTTQANEEGAATVKALSSPQILPENEGKLVHVSGQAITEEKLKDPELNVGVAALKLSRQVEYYQWKEGQSSKSEKKVGGSEETTTTYNYTLVWSDDYISSDDFKVAENHTNSRAVSLDDHEFTAQVITVGDFQLESALSRQINQSQRLTLPDTLSVANAIVKNNYIYFGSKNESEPKVGDVRVSFNYVLPHQVSVVAKQVGSSLTSYETSSGKSLALLEYGSVAPSKMFDMAESRNMMWTWILRIGGFFMMFIGLRLIFRPLSVAGDVVPFIGNIIGMGIGLASGIVAFCFSIGTIAIAWIFYRPVLGISLLVVGVALFIFIRQRSVKKKLQTA